MSFIRTKKIKGHVYRYLVESVRVNGKIKQRVLKYLGRADEDMPVVHPVTKNRAVPKVNNKGVVTIYVGRKHKGKHVETSFRVLD